MKCTNCGSQKMVKMALIANQIWKVKVADEIKKNKYDKKYCQKVLRKIMGFPTKEISIMYGEFTFCDDITEKYQMKINGVEQKRVLKDQLILILSQVKSKFPASP